MKLAVVGSRSLEIHDLGRYLPAGVTEIVSGGAKGVDSSARRYALDSGIVLTEILPKYGLYGKRAPLLRDDEIAACCDRMLAFWDGRSRGTVYTVKIAQKLGKPVTMIRIENGEEAYRVTFLTGNFRDELPGASVDDVLRAKEAERRETAENA